MTRNPRLLAYAQFLRLPNVFTAFADILLAAFVVGAWAAEWPTIIMLLLASGCLYLSGMAWNDWFDLDEDRQARAFRPLPSGRISVTIAVLIAATLMIMGITFAAIPQLVGWTESNAPLTVAVGLAVMILLYDGLFKSSWAGPIAMGGCRFLNVCLGCSPFLEVLPTALPWHLAGVIGVYIVGVTWFARTEEQVSQKRWLIAATGVMGLAVLGGALLPIHRPLGATPGYFLPLLAVGVIYVGRPLIRAITLPIPQHVQNGVKSAIFGLVILDAILATAFAGLPGLAIILLLIPAILLGKWVYST